MESSAQPLGEHYESKGTMPQDYLTDTQVEKLLREAGAYRVRRAQVIALEGEPDGVSGSLLIAMALRETKFKNIEGGARLVDGEWVAEDRPEYMDVGCIQINRRWHANTLKSWPAVKAGTWAPVVLGKTPYDLGYVPRFEEAMRFTLSYMHENMAYGADNFVDADDLPRFAVAAHNCGSQGALNGYKAGDIDKYTASGDYSAWVLRTRTQVNKFLVRNPNWKV